MPQNILEATPFPECTTNCKCIEYFGVCECESICPWKFDQEGNYLSEEDIMKRKVGLK